MSGGGYLINCVSKRKGLTKSIESPVIFLYAKEMSNADIEG